MLEKIKQIFANTKYYDWLKKHPEKRRTNYQRGAGFEQRVVEHFRKHGYFAKRNWGSHGTHINGRTFKDDGFAFKTGIVWTAKWSKNKETNPEDYPDDVKCTKQLAHLFGLVPVFAGISKNRRIKLINLDTMKELKL